MPAGATNIKFDTSGGTGDGDLYVRKGAQSTTSLYDCRPWKDGNNETCSFTSPTATTYYIDVYGYSATSGVSVQLTATP